VILELKTKSAGIEDLLDLDHNRKIILSWSLAPVRVVGREEPRTNSLGARLDAAKRVEREGYLLGFHFDPIIRYEGWEDDYRELLDSLFSTIDQKNTVWISLGCLRFPPHLKEVAFERRNRVEIFLDEFVPCRDGKMRYLRTIREEIYGKVLEWLRERAPSVEIYMCMESSLMWENVFGQKPDSDSWLSDRLDRAVFRKTGSVMSSCRQDG
jgi:spore photoproduct lyase